VKWGVYYAKRHGANSSRKYNFLADKRGEDKLQTSFLVERGFSVLEKPLNLKRGRRRWDIIH
jgi:hypothetical protein